MKIRFPPLRNGAENILLPEQSVLTYPTQAGAGSVLSAFDPAEVCRAVPIIPYPAKRLQGARGRGGPLTPSGSLWTSTNRREEVSGCSGHNGSMHEYEPESLAQRLIYLGFSSLVEHSGSPRLSVPWLFTPDRPLSGPAPWLV